MIKSLDLKVLIMFQVHVCTREASGRITNTTLSFIAVTLIDFFPGDTKTQDTDTHFCLCFLFNFILLVFYGTQFWKAQINVGLSVFSG